MRRTERTARGTRRCCGARALLAAVAAGAVLLGACGAISPPAGRGASRTTGRQPCSSLAVSCLARKVGGKAPTTTSPARVRRTSLGPGALGPLAGELQAGDRQVMLAAMDGLSPAAAGGVTSHLDALSSSEAARLGADLQAALSADPTNARAYAEALVGSADARVAPAVAGAELQTFRAILGALPGELANGNSQVASLVAEILSTTVPHIEQMMQYGLSQLPAQVVPLALADANRGLAEAPPTELGDYVALLEDPSAEALATRTAYEAGYACGSTLTDTCTPFDRWVLSVSGLKTAPALIQQDIVDCVVLPLCTQVEYQGVISWVDQVAADSSASAAEVQGLSTEMEANSFLATERWMEALS